MFKRSGPYVVQAWVGSILVTALSHVFNREHHVKVIHLEVGSVVSEHAKKWRLKIEVALSLSPGAKSFS